MLTIFFSKYIKVSTESWLKTHVSVTKVFNNLQPSSTPLTLSTNSTVSTLSIKGDYGR